MKIDFGLNQKNYYEINLIDILILRIFSKIRFLIFIEFHLYLNFLSKLHIFHRKNTFIKNLNKTLQKMTI